VARAEPPWYDPDLPGLLASARAPVAVAALRNATPGLPVDRSGLLPLVQGRWSFVLNGWVPDFRARHARALRTGLPDELYAALGGPSDAETLFLLAVATIEHDGATPLEALEGVARSVSERLDTGEQAPLTMVLASAEGVWALNAVAGGGPCNSLWVARAPTMAPDGVLLASEALDEDPAWERVPPHARVELGHDGSVRVLPGEPS
jgi:glutamine amidotransferase